VRRFTSLGCVKDRAYGEFVGAVTQSPNSSFRGRNMCEKRAGFKPREEPEMVQALQNLVLEAGVLSTQPLHILQPSFLIALPVQVPLSTFEMM